MNCTFPWMTFWTAVAAVGSIAVAILAVWGDWFRSKLAAPNLIILEQNIRGDLTQFGNGLQTIFYHLKVKNLKTWVTAQNCRVMLVAISKRGPDGQFRPVPMPVPLPFFWAPSEFSPAAETITDERVFDLGFLPKTKTGFHPQLIVMPNNFKGIIKANEAVRYSLQISADNFVSSIQVFEVAWDGTWIDDLDAMANNLAITEVKR